MTSKMNAFASENDAKYLLMNKDELIAHFHVNGITDGIIIDKVDADLPSWIHDLEAFIENRKAPKSRENIEKLLKESGCDTNRGYLDITHALSLIDTFWAKPEGSSLVWKDMSLYTHDFNETIAKTAFEGGLHGQHLSDTSPEYGTDGTFAKCWIREEGQIKLLKRGSSGARNAGLEPYSEFYASQLIKEFSEDFVAYDLRSRSGRICSVCDIFTSEEFGFLPYASVAPENSTYNSVIRKYGEMGFGDFAKIDEYLSMKGPRLSRDWIKPVLGFMTPSAKKALIRLKGFEFKRHPRHNLPDWRLKALEELINKNIEEILSYV